MPHVPFVLPLLPTDVTTLSGTALTTFDVHQPIARIRVLLFINRFVPSLEGETHVQKPAGACPDRAFASAGH
jgi:hypothetical protein